MNLDDLRVFSAVAAERSFSKAASRVGRTQPAVSQAVRRLEEAVGGRLIDRAQRDGTLTQAGVLLLDYAARMLRLSDEAQAAVADLRDVERGRVRIGANEAAVHVLLPVIGAYLARHPRVQIDVRRISARNIAVELQQRGIDVGVLTFPPADRDLVSITIATDEMVLLVPPSHPFARRKEVPLDEVGRQTVIAHNDPSPARERVLRISEERHAPLNISLSLPSLDGIKRAVELGLGVAILPRRCALSEISLGQLHAVRVPELRALRRVRLVHRRGGSLSAAAAAFVEQARRESREKA
ncbi:MAG TPA: LysR substrate-binding domain-containing protein [Vicinamibacterales bacterium]|nr:LysR substrate-binding domain-containing protein [Vicinamibacterales bacterium]